MGISGDFRVVNCANLPRAHAQRCNLGSCAGPFTKKTPRYQLPCRVVKWGHLHADYASAASLPCPILSVKNHAFIGKVITALEGVHYSS